jgi:general secretion pathway protein B
MSLILDALRRADGGGLSPSTEVVQITESRALAPQYVVLTALAVGVVVGGAVMMWLDPVEPAPSLSNAAPRPEASAPVRIDDGASSPGLIGDNGIQPAPAATGLDPRLASAASASAPDKASLATLNKEMWSDASRSEPGASASSVVSPVNDAGETSPMAPPEPASPNATQASRSIAPPIDLAGAIERAAREVGDVPLTPHSAALLENLSQQQKDQIPTIVYVAHEFSEVGARSVTLNGRRLIVGQRVDGIEVLEILNDSVVLRAGSIEFRLRALNTWVNL